MNLEPRPALQAQTHGELPYTPSTQLAKVSLGLALLTFLVFLPLVEHTFVNYDDDVFVTNNPKVAPGLTWEGIKWAFTTTEIDFWRPLSWLSHMVDMELFGLVGGLHHLTSLMIHIAATVMLLLALHRLTGELWPSAMVAAIFAWHPLHVESVAWIAERKDVLCGFFWFFTLWAYARYVEKPDNQRYALVLLGFLFGAMSKPMIVTLPCVLLLLDYWPLGRMDLSVLNPLHGPGWRTKLSSVWPLVAEKIPLFAGVLALSLSTVASQEAVGTETSSFIPLLLRVYNSLAAYSTYIRQAIWPTDLCVLYPYNYVVPVWGFISVSLFFGSICLLGLALARRFPFFLVGWLWFIGVLVPVIGLFKVVGEQAHADRYTYVPLVGLSVALVWALRSWIRSHSSYKRWLIATAILTLLGMAIITRLQLRHWEDSIHLFGRAIQVNPANASAHNNIGAELMMLKRHQEAIPFFEKATKLPRPSAQAFVNLIYCKLSLNEFAHAQILTVELLTRFPNSPEAKSLVQTLYQATKQEGTRTNERKILAIAMATQGDFEGAAWILGEVVRATPEDAVARIDRAAYLAMAGKDSAAQTLLESTLGIAPTNVMARSNLGALLAKKGKIAEALVHYREALRLDPKNRDTRHNFALALVRDSRLAEAQAEFEAVLSQNPDFLPSLQQLAWLLATYPECQNIRDSLKHAQRALTLSRSVQSLDVAAAAYAVSGDFGVAIQLITEALELARKERDRSLEDAIRARLAIYQTKRPFLQPAAAKIQQ